MPWSGIVEVKRYTLTDGVRVDRQTGNLISGTYLDLELTDHQPPPNGPPVIMGWFEFGSREFAQDDAGIGRVDHYETASQILAFFPAQKFDFFWRMLRDEQPVTIVFDVDDDSKLTVFALSVSRPPQSGQEGHPALVHRVLDPIRGYGEPGPPS